MEESLETAYRSYKKGHHNYQDNPWQSGYINPSAQIFERGRSSVSHAYWLSWWGSKVLFLQTSLVYKRGLEGISKKRVVSGWGNVTLLGKKKSTKGQIVCQLSCSISWLWVPSCSQKTLRRIPPNTVILSSKSSVHQYLLLASRDGISERENWGYKFGTSCVFRWVDQEICWKMTTQRPENSIYCLNFKNCHYFTIKMTINSHFWTKAVG